MDNKQTLEYCKIGPVMRKDLVAVGERLGFSAGLELCAGVSQLHINEAIQYFDLFSRDCR